MVIHQSQKSGKLPQSSSTSLRLSWSTRVMDVICIRKEGYSCRLATPAASSHVEEKQAFGWRILTFCTVTCWIEIKLVWSVVGFQQSATTIRVQIPSRRLVQLVLPATNSKPKEISQNHIVGHALNAARRSWQLLALLASRASCTKGASDHGLVHLQGHDEAVKSD